MSNFLSLVSRMYNSYRCHVDDKSDCRVGVVFLVVLNLCSDFVCAGGQDLHHLFRNKNQLQ